MKAVEQTFSHWCDFFLPPFSLFSFLFSLLICFDTWAANAWRSVGDRLIVSPKSKQGKCNYSSSSQQFCKRWMSYTVHAVSHKGSDLHGGSQILTTTLLVQGHLEGLGFVVLLQPKRDGHFQLCISSPMTTIVTSYFDSGEGSDILLSAEPAAEQTSCGCARWGSA